MLQQKQQQQQQLQNNYSSLLNKSFYIEHQRVEKRSWVF
jgi:hypothetical protein